jgi:glycosyltransferase involved in cell wall biosynthesis
MNKNRLATSPVIVFSYNRPKHLQDTIEALQNNFHATHTELFIISDGSKDATSEQDVQKIRTYIRTIKGFKKINIIERNTNYGLANNIISGVSEIIDQYEKVIVLEDDLITSSNFLCYMNEALEHYSKIDHVFSISGFTNLLPSLPNLQQDTYLSCRPSSWGWATWKDRWITTDWELIDFSSFIQDKNACKKFNQGGSDMTNMLKDYIAGKNNSWAIRWAYTMFKQNKYCIYPTKSKVDNTGFGAGATHCKGYNIYQSELDTSNQCDFIFTNDTFLNPKIMKEFRYQFSLTNKLIKKSKGLLNKLHF